MNSDFLRWQGQAPNFKQQKTEHPQKDTPFGPSGESRTHGLLNPIQARYQTALHPVGMNYITMTAIKMQAFFEKNIIYFCDIKEGMALGR